MCNRARRPALEHYHIISLSGECLPSMFVTHNTATFGASVLRFLVSRPSEAVAPLHSYKHHTYKHHTTPRYIEALVSSTDGARHHAHSSRPDPGIYYHQGAAINVTRSAIFRTYSGGRVQPDATSISRFFEKLLEFSRMPGDQ